MNHEIKSNADKNYIIYEESINDYYNYKKNFLPKNLTIYVYTFYIESDYRSAILYNDNVNCSMIHMYIRILYFTYSAYYIKNYISINESLISKFYQIHMFDRYLTSFVREKININISLHEYIRSCFKVCKQLKFRDLWDVDRIDIMIYLSRLIDYIVECQKVALSM